MDSPVSQLESILRRHRLAILEHLQNTPRQFCPSGEQTTILQKTTTLA